jgi:signal peptidase I
MKAFLLAFWEVAEIVLIAVVTVFFIRTFLMQPFLVSGASMEPNFSTGNYLVVDEISYRLGSLERNDVVVFEYPNDPSVYYIKRIIALPGEHIVLKDSIVEIEGEVLDEFYLRDGIRTSGEIDVVLDEDDYFVMGDNRNVSYDSRTWGSLPEDNIVGIVRLRLFPLDSIKFFQFQSN